MGADHRVVELRQYTLHPGERDVLIDLFEREFVESQEVVGMGVIGQFRDLDNPDRFVWLRGFPDMPSRAESLRAFYGGPVWAEHKDAANATMVDSDDVLLLRPAREDSGFPESNDRPPVGAEGSPSRGLVVATVCHPEGPEEADFLAFFEDLLGPALREAGAPTLAYFVTETSPNNFPALPVREDERVFVWFSLFPDEAAYEAFCRRGAEVYGALGNRLERPPEVLRLSPTARSLLHG